MRKGLETPLLIKGMQAKHYWLLMFLSIGAVLYQAGGLYGMVSGDQISFKGWIMQLIACGALLFFLWQYFLSLGKPRRYKFRKQDSTLSNRDLLDYL